MNTSEHAYDQAWRRYRRLRLHWWVAFAGFGLSALATVFADLPSRFGWKGFVPVLAFWLYGVVATIRFKRFPCPRCGRDFERRWPSKKPFVPGSCLHCGLEKFSEPDK